MKISIISHVNNEASPFFPFPLSVVNYHALLIVFLSRDPSGIRSKLTAIIV